MHTIPSPFPHIHQCTYKQVFSYQNTYNQAYHIQTYRYIHTSRHIHICTYAVICDMYDPCVIKGMCVYNQSRSKTEAVLVACGGETGRGCAGRHVSRDTRRLVSGAIAKDTITNSGSLECCCCCRCCWCCLILLFFGVSCSCSCRLMLWLLLWSSHVVVVVASCCFRLSPLSCCAAVASCCFL